MRIKFVNEKEMNEKKRMKCNHLSLQFHSVDVSLLKKCFSTSGC